MSAIRQNPTPRRRGPEGAWRALLPAVLADVRGSMPDMPAVNVDVKLGIVAMLSGYKAPLYLKAACRLHRLSFDTLRDAMARDPELNDEVQAARMEGIRHCLQMAALDGKNSRHWEWCAERYDRDELHLTTKIDAKVATTTEATSTRVAQAIAAAALATAKG